MRLQFPVIHAFCADLETFAAILPGPVPEEFDKLHEEMLAFKVRTLDRQLVYAYANGFTTEEANDYQPLTFKFGDTIKKLAEDCCGVLDAAYEERGNLEAYLEVRRCFTDLSESLSPRLSSSEMRLSMLCLLFQSGREAAKRKSILGLEASGLKNRPCSPRKYLSSYVASMLCDADWLNEETPELRYIAFTYKSRPLECRLMVCAFSNVLRRYDGLPENMHALFLSFFSEGLYVARNHPDGLRELVLELQAHGSLKGTISCFTSRLPEDTRDWLPEKICQAGHDYIESNYNFLTQNLYPWAAWLRAIYFLRVYADYVFWAGLYQGNPDIFHELSD